MDINMLGDIMGECQWLWYKQERGGCTCPGLFRTANRFLATKIALPFFPTYVPDFKLLRCVDSWVSSPIQPNNVKLQIDPCIGPVNYTFILTLRILRVYPNVHQSGVAGCGSYHGRMRSGNHNSEFNRWVMVIVWSNCLNSDSFILQHSKSES